MGEKVGRKRKGKKEVRISFVTKERQMKGMDK